MAFKYMAAKVTAITISPQNSHVAMDGLWAEYLQLCSNSNYDCNTTLLLYTQTSHWKQIIMSQKVAIGTFAVSTILLAPGVSILNIIFWYRKWVSPSNIEQSMVSKTTGNTISVNKTTSWRNKRENWNTDIWRNWPVLYSLDRSPKTFIFITLISLYIFTICNVHVLCKQAFLIFTFVEKTYCICSRAELIPQLN